MRRPKHAEVDIDALFFNANRNENVNQDGGDKEQRGDSHHHLEEDMGAFAATAMVKDSFIFRIDNASKFGISFHHRCPRCA